VAPFALSLIALLTLSAMPAVGSPLASPTPAAAPTKHHVTSLATTDYLAVSGTLAILLISSLLLLKKFKSQRNTIASDHKQLSELLSTLEDVNLQFAKFRAEVNASGLSPDSPNILRDQRFDLHPTQPIAEILRAQPDLSIETHPDDRELAAFFADRTLREFYKDLRRVLFENVSDVILVGPEFCGKSIVLRKIRFDLQGDKVNYVVYANASSGCTFNFLARELNISLRSSDITFADSETREIEKLLPADQHDFTAGEFVQMLSRCIDNVLVNHGFKRIVLIIDELDDLYTKDPTGVTKLLLDFGHLFAEPRYQIVCDCLPKMEVALMRAGISPDVRIVSMPELSGHTLCEIVLDRIQSAISDQDRIGLHRTYPFSYSAMHCLGTKSRGNLGIALAIADQAIRSNRDKWIIDVADVTRAAGQPAIARIKTIIEKGTHFTLLERLRERLFEIALFLLLGTTIIGFFCILWYRQALMKDKAWVILGPILGALISSIVVLVALRLNRDK
jgi:hypothetical protein